MSLRIITLPDTRIDQAERLAQGLASVCPTLRGVRTSWAAPVAKTATINAGHVVMRLTHDTEAEALTLPLAAAWRSSIAPDLEDAHVATVGYRLTRPCVRRSGPGVWRALVFRVVPNTDQALVRRLEEATLRLPRHIDAIRSWALSPVSFSEGLKSFTHVWEQEFDSVADLTGPYMSDPAHWGIADAFFDAEYPEYIVDPQLIQVVGPIDCSLILGRA